MVSAVLLTFRYCPDGAEGGGASGIRHYAVAVPSSGLPFRIPTREAQEAERAMSLNSEHPYGFLGFLLVCSSNATQADWRARQPELRASISRGGLWRQTDCLKPTENVVQSTTYQCSPQPELDPARCRERDPVGCLEGRSWASAGLVSGRCAGVVSHVPLDMFILCGRMIWAEQETWCGMAGGYE